MKEALEKKLQPHFVRAEMLDARMVTKRLKKYAQVIDLKTLEMDELFVTRRRTLVYTCTRLHPREDVQIVKSINERNGLWAPYFTEN